MARTITSVLRALGFRRECTGGDCTGYVRQLPDGRWELLTLADEASCPASFRDPVTVGDWDGDGSDGVTYSSLRMYLAATYLHPNAPHYVPMYGTHATVVAQ